MTDYLDLELLISIAERAIKAQILVADYGLLESVLARPRATVFGQDAYPTVYDKAAALLESLTLNHALVDGNMRLAWAATVTFCYINGCHIVAPDDDAYDLVVEITSGGSSDVRLGVDKIAERLAAWSRPR